MIQSYTCNNQIKPNLKLLVTIHEEKTLSRENTSWIGALTLEMLEYLVLELEYVLALVLLLYLEGDVLLKLAVVCLPDVT